MHREKKCSYYFYYAVTYIVAEEKYSQKNIEVCKLNHEKQSYFSHFLHHF